MSQISKAGIKYRTYQTIDKKQDYIKTDCYT